ncbi:hypothetical protein Lal_00018031 [Lupinus albus]|nr:hypothetical protein Lal_00018031 [Lupinus albus]
MNPDLKLLWLQTESPQFTSLPAMGLSMTNTQNIQRMKSSGSRSSEPILAQERQLSLKRGSSRSSEDLTASTGPEGHFSRPGETILAQTRPLSLKRESFSIAHDFTLPASSDAKPADSRLKRKGTRTGRKQTMKVAKDPNKPKKPPSTFFVFMV